MKKLILFTVTIMIYLASFGQGDMSIEQKEFIIQYSLDNFKSINKIRDLPDDLKRNSQSPTNLSQEIDKNKLASNFLNTLLVENIRGNEIFLTSELAGFPNVNDIEFSIKYKSVLDSEDKEILDMTQDKMMKESKSSSAYKPTINGLPGFKTSVFITPTDNEIGMILGEISIKIPSSYDILEFDLSNLNEVKKLNENTFKLIELKDNIIGLEIIGDNSNYKILPLNVEGKEYASVTKKAFPLSVYELLSRDSNLEELAIKKIAEDIIINSSGKVIIYQVSGNVSKILIYAIDII